MLESSLGAGEAGWVVALARAEEFESGKIGFRGGALRSRQSGRVVADLSAEELAASDLAASGLAASGLAAWAWTLRLGGGDAGLVVQLDLVVDDLPQFVRLRFKLRFLFLRLLKLCEGFLELLLRLREVVAGGLLRVGGLLSGSLLILRERLLGFVHVPRRIADAGCRLGCDGRGLFLQVLRFLLELRLLVRRHLPGIGSVGPGGGISERILRGLEIVGLLLEVLRLGQVVLAGVAGGILVRDFIGDSGAWPSAGAAVRPAGFAKRAHSDRV